VSRAKKTGGVCAAVLLCWLLCWLYLRQSRTAGVNSDAAAQVLQGWEMLHGNPLLRGWFLSDVSFYTLEVPLDGLVALAHGLGPDTAHVTAAIVYTLLVACAALLARGRARGREGAVRALLAAGVLLAPGLSPGSQVLLLAPDHTGVGVPVLLALLVVDRAPARWYLPVASCVLLVWAQVDDPVATFGCALPLAAVCTARAIRAARTRRARPGPDAGLAVAAVASYGLTRLVLTAIHAVGGFYVYGVAYGFAPVQAIPRQLLWTGQNLLYLFGASYWHLPPLQAAFGYLHLAGVAVAASGLALGARELFFRLGVGDRVTQTLTAGLLVTLAAGAFGTYMEPVQGAHEIAVVLPLGAVLGGRLIGPWLAGAWDARGAGVPGVPPAGLRRAWRGRAAVASLLALAGAGYLGALGYDASRPAQPAAGQALAYWLASHGLTSGLGGYWQANAATLASGGRVLLAPLADGGASAYAWNSKAAWYDPRVSSADFIVTVGYPPGQVFYAQPAVIRAAYGRPARTYHFGQYSIMVYSYDLLLRVRQPAVGRG
jgi:hypothetical protein